MSIYTDNGYSSRKEYLQSLAEDYGIDLAEIQAVAFVLGPDEDFDGLVTELQDRADERDDIWREIYS